MTATITWEISRLDVKPTDGSLSDVVVTAHWRCTGTQDNYTGTVYSTCSFPIPEEGDEDFVLYSELTEEIVLGWIWQNGVDKDAAEAAVQQQIDNQINPPIIHPPLPWSQS